MSLFKHILIPVESPIQSQIALDKALELADPIHTTIHLVAIIRPVHFWEKFIYTTEALARQQRRYNRKAQLAADKLASLAKRISDQGHSLQIITATIRENGNNDQLIRYANEHDADLLIIGNPGHKHIRSFSKKDMATELANHANLAVLTVDKSCINKPLKSILLPVTSFVPERRIQMAMAFAKKFNAHIHLVTLLDKNDTASKIRIDAFYLTYKILVEYGLSPQYKILQGADSNESLIRYANQIKADMILLTPVKKNKFFGFLRKTSEEFMQPFSALQVLTLKPYKR